MNSRAVALLVVAAMVLVGCSGVATPPSTSVSAAQAPVRTLTISGEGKAEGAPDTALIYVGVETRNPDAATAMDENNTKIQSVIERLKALGIAEKDLQTSGFGISFQPVYDNTGNITGSGTYVVTNSLTVKVREIDKTGAILGEAVRAGANSVNGVTFTVDNPAALYALARAAAVADARAKAEALAKELGVTLGKVLTVNEGGGYSPVFYDKAMATGLGGGGAVPIQTGSYTLSLTISVTFEIL